MKKPFGQTVTEEEDFAGVPVYPVGEHIIVEGPDFILNPSQEVVEPYEAPPKPPIRVENTEFRTHDEQKVVVERRKARILELAKQIFEGKAEELARYADAVKLVKAARKKKTAMENPTKELRKALMIVEEGPPITKQLAVERATKEYYNEERLMGDAAYQ